MKQINGYTALPMLTITTALYLLAPMEYLLAQDWPAWGGARPERNMVAEAKGLPSQFDPGKSSPDSDNIDLKSTKNVRWVAKLGSQSYGNPVVAQGKVFVGTNNDFPRDPKYKGDHSILLCLDEKTGELLWQLATPKLESGKDNDWESIGMVCSPSVEGNRVYLVTTRCEVLCLDIEGMANGNDGPFKDEAKYFAGKGKPDISPGPKDADIIWQYSMIDALHVYPHNAANCSVLVLNDIVYAATSNGQDADGKIPSPNSPSLIALDKKSGRLLGQDDAFIGPRIYHGQWGSPSAGQVNGKWLVFYGGGDGFCYALDATPEKVNGTNWLRKVWWYDCNPEERKMREGKPVKYGDVEGPSEINATPVFWKNRIYVAVGQDPENGDGAGHLVCIDATQKGDITKTGTIWSYKEINRSLSSVSITPDGLLFINDLAGYLYCMNAENGLLFWKHDAKAHVWGSTLVADGKVFTGDEDGDFIILAASKEKKLLFETNFNGPIYSSAITANQSIYISTSSYLYSIRTQ